MASAIENHHTPGRKVLTDLSEVRLAAAVELNSAAWLRLQGQLPWVELHDDGDALWVFAGDTWPRNSVVLARFAAESARRRIEEILTPHLARKVACNWVVGPISEPADLGNHLRALGFRCMIHCAGMACDLSCLPPSRPVPDDVRIALVDQPPTRHPLTTDRRRRRHEGRAAMLSSQPVRMWCLVASVDNTPVGETILFTGAGVAGLYDVEVLEKYRGRGIGSSLVHAALGHAQKLGYRAAVLSATGMGLGVYSRLNFREVCKLSFYKYGKMRQLVE